MQTTSRAVSPQDRQSLRNHIVNLRQGQFSTDGDFATTRQDVERIFAVALPAALAEAQAANRKLRLLFYAHGGLVDEASGIGNALAQLPFWKANNIYPIFFVWETGILDVLADLLRKLLLGQRGVGDVFKELKAKALEGLARPGGVRVWGNMKLSAQAASAADGGAKVVASLAAQFFNAHGADMEIHTCGHSAGAIFHAFFLPALTGEGANVASLHLLAPAVNVPTFKARILPLVGNRLGAITMFTMQREFERDDTAGPYPKSLLYFVHHAFEDPDETPILGLEENLTADGALETALTTAPNEVVFSVTDPAASKRSSSRSIHHGDFDNDAPTMNSVCRRILGVNDGTAIVDFPETRGRSFDPLERLNQELAAAAAGPARDADPAAGGTTGFGRSNMAGGAVAAAGAILNTGTAAGRRTALCIGVDTYPAPNTLQGCVNDSRAWEELFRELGYSVTALRDDAATRAAITDAIARQVAALKAGDICLIQYAGHGVQFPDDSGDEPDNKDEALCPVDMMTAGFIRDDEMRAILNRIPTGARVFCFFDCCHSSSIARMVREVGQDNRSRIRAITPTAEMIAVHQQTRTPGRVATPAVRRDIVFAACRDDQVAFESAGHGDYTTLAVPIIRQHGKGVTNIAMQKLIQVEFGSGARQNPTLDCTQIDETLAFLLP